MQSGLYIYYMLVDLKEQPILESGKESKYVPAALIYYDNSKVLTIARLHESWGCREGTYAAWAQTDARYYMSNRQSPSSPDMDPYEASYAVLLDPEFKIRKRG